MFRNLRFKLTFINVVVTSIVFFLFTLGVFIVLERSLNDQIGDLINLVSFPPEEGDFSKIIKKEHSEHKYKYFFVNFSSSGKITSASKNLDLENEHFLKIVTKALKSPKTVDRISSDDESYYFVKKNLTNSSEISITFINATYEEDIYHKLLFVLLLASILGLVLAFFASLFMADRSLIPIKESWERQRDFVADASHELRTPLSVINTTLDLILSKPDKTIESQLKWLDNIQTENKRMSKLVNDLLLLAKADSNQEVLEKKVFALHSALLEIYIPFEALAIQKGIHLGKFNGTPVNFLGDEQKIKQLVVILIDNAIKYTGIGGYVGMSLIDKGDSVEITVSDTGEGIEKEHVNKIFHRFYRVNKSRSRSEGSVGLGLSIAAWIVEMHHGSIKVESIKGSGSTFRITLPKKR